MAQIPLTFFLLVLLFLSLSCVRASDLVDNVCAKSVNPSFCRAALRSDGRSATADYTGLGRVVIDLTRSHARDTSNEIQTLIAQNKNPNLKKPLAICLDKYNVDVPDACTRASTNLNARDYTGFYLAGDTLSNYGKLCAYALQVVVRPPLGFNNQKTVMLSLSCAKNDVVDLICGRTKYPSLCKGIFEVGNRTYRSVDIIGLFTIDLATSNAKIAIDLVNTLIGRAQDPGLKKNLIFCRYQYESVALNALSKAFVDLNTYDYKQLYKDGLELEEAGIICGSTLLGLGNYSANLTSKNQKTRLYGEILSVVATLN